MDREKKGKVKLNEEEKVKLNGEEKGKVKLNEEEKGKVKLNEEVVKQQSNVIETWQSTVARRGARSGGGGARPNKKQSSFTASLQSTATTRTLDGRMEMRKRQAEDLDISLPPKPPSVYITLSTERVALLKRELAKKKELCDYIAIKRNLKNGENLLTFRSPEQLVYNEACYLHHRNKDRWKRNFSRSHLVKDVCMSKNKGTQTQIPTRDVAKDKSLVPETHSMLYFYRYVTAQSQEDLAGCRYLRKTPLKTPVPPSREPADSRVPALAAAPPSRDPAVHQPFFYRPPPIKKNSKMSLRKQQSRLLHQIINDL